MRTECCHDQRKTSLTLLALLRKRKRLGYMNLRIRKLTRMVYGSILNHKCRLGRLHRARGRKVRRWWQRPIFQDHDLFGAWNVLIPQLRETDADLYYNFLRMTPSCFDSLLEKVSPFLEKTSWRKAIEPGERLAITLRYLASGDSQTSLSYLFRVSSEAISKIVLETTAVLWNVLKDDVFPELTQETWLKTAAEFEVMWNIPHCEGALDGKQVQVKAFPCSGSRWYGYKKVHCMTLMAVSDAKHKFLIVECGASGKRADANIFYKSAFAKGLRKKTLDLPPPCPVDTVDGDMPFYFVADNAYPISQHMATPFKGDLRDEEMVYNYRLSRARRIIENAFGILTARFRILRRPIEGSQTLVRAIILACMALHNLHLGDEESVPPKSRKYVPYGYADYVRDDGKYIYGRWRNEDRNNERTLFKKLCRQVQNSRAKDCAMKGRKLREMLVRYFTLNPVEWQWERAHLL